MADPAGNYTRIPNELLEAVMRLPGAGCQVMLTVIRRTIGWHKVSDVISLAQLAEATELSRQGVVNGIEAAIRAGLLRRTPVGTNNGFAYEVVHNVDYPSPEVVNEIDYLAPQVVNVEPASSQQSRLEVVNEIDYLAPQVVNKVDTQKKDLKEKKERGLRAVRKRTAAAPDSEPAESEPPTPANIRAVLADLCSIDLEGRTATRAQTVSLNAEAKRLWQAAQSQGKNATECEHAIRYVAGWVRQTVYPFSNGQPLTPAAIRERWRAAMDARSRQTAAYPPARAAPDHDPPPALTADQFRAGLMAAGYQGPV